jgi:hypothetical protein
MNAFLLIFVLFIFSISDKKIGEFELAIPIVIFIGIVMLLILVIKELRAERKGTIGFRVDSNRLYIGNAIKNIQLNKERIEFVYIDHYYQTLYVKTTRKPKTRITGSLLKDPKKFILKIPQMDRLFYSHGSRAIAIIPKFIETLKHFNIDVYIREKNSDIISKQ